MSETNTKRIVVDGIISNLPSPVLYTPEMVGSKLISGSGQGVNICLVDTGVPEHDAILNKGDDINFSKSPDSKDRTGHATSLAGIIAANKPDQLVGLAPNATLLSAKAVDDNCVVRFDALIASVLWGIIKDVDIIVIPICTDIDHLPFKAVIEKAISEGIFVVAAAGNSNKIEYPAKYEGVISVGAKNRRGGSTSYSAHGDIRVIGSNLETTYLNNSYCVSSGTSVATAVVAGLLARAIESDRDTALTRLKLLTK